MTHGVDGGVLGGDVVVDLLVVEARQRGTDVVSLSHLEVLSEVLVSAPPVGVDHAESLVSAGLMEVRVSHVVLLAIGGHSSVAVVQTVHLVGLTKSPSPVLHHLLLLILNDDSDKEVAVEMVDEEGPDESESVLGVEGAHFPVQVSGRVLVEANDVLEGSPSLGVVTGLVGGKDEFGEVTVSLLGKSSKQNKTNKMLRSTWIDSKTYLPIMSARSLMLGTP